jgi:hypothetical protein
MGSGGNPRTLLKERVVGDAIVPRLRVDTVRGRERSAKPREQPRLVLRRDAWVACREGVDTAVLARGERHVDALLLGGLSAWQHPPPAPSFDVGHEDADELGTSVPVHEATLEVRDPRAFGVDRHPIAAVGPALELAHHRRHGVPLGVHETHELLVFEHDVQLWCHARGGRQNGRPIRSGDEASSRPIRLVLQLP